MSYRPSEIEVFAASELGLVAVLTTSLDALEAQLRFEHRTHEDPGPNPAPVLAQALAVLASTAALRTELRRYRRSVLRSLAPGRRPDDDPSF